MEVWLQEASQVIADAGESSTDACVQEAIVRIAEWSSSLHTSSASSKRAYSSVASILLDRGAEWLANCGSADRDAVEHAFDSVFLEGPAELAFQYLIDALQGHDGGHGGIQDGQQSFAAVEASARILQLFVARNLDGVNRLARVISAMDDDTKISSALTHLPSILANMSTTAPQGSTAEFDGTEYYRVLADSLFETYLNRSIPSGINAATGDTTVEWSSVSAVGTLIGRLCVLGQANCLVHSWCQHPLKGSARMASLVLRAPTVGLVPLVRAVIEEQVDDPRDRQHEAFTVQVLGAILGKSKIAVDALCLQLPFRRPLMKRRGSLLRIVRAMVASGFGWEGLRAGAQIWSGPHYSRSPDVALQGQATRIVLLYMSAIFDRSPGSSTRETASDGNDSLIDSSKLTTLAISLAEGVSSRLSSSQRQVRRFGMVAGEALSRIQGDASLELRFPREASTEETDPDGYDSDLSELAELQWSKFEESWELGDPSEEKLAPSQLTEESAANAVDQNVSVHNDAEVSHSHLVDPQSWWCDDDDWTSLSSFEMSSDEEFNVRNGEDSRLLPMETKDNARGGGKKAVVSKSDYEMVKKQLAAPFSISRTVGLLHALNNGDDKLAMEPELIAATLRTICEHALKTQCEVKRLHRSSAPSELAETGTSTFSQRIFHRFRTSMYGFPLRESAVTMMKAVLGVDSCRFPEKIGNEVAVARKEALNALIQLDIRSVGCALVSEIFYGQTADVTRRAEVLALLADAVRAVTDDTTGSETAADPGNPETAGHRRMGSPEKQLGRVTRRSEKSISLRRQREAKHRAEVKVNLFSGAADALFFSIANSLFDDAGADFIDLSTRHAGLLAQALATAALVLSRSGVQCLNRREMCLAMLELCAVWYKNDSVVVRRAVALALGSVARTIDRVWLQDGYGTEVIMGDSSRMFQRRGGILMQWLKDSAQGGDADVYVRQFAGTALREWLETLTDE